MIAILGDIHGMIEVIVDRFSALTENDTVIQVGDFGMYEDMFKSWKQYAKDKVIPRCKIYCIDGNHEDYSIVRNYSKKKVKKIGHNLFHVPRGEVLTIEGKRIGFLGGAESVDKAWRKDGVSWWADESVTAKDVERLIKNAGDEQLDLLVTHAPPADTIAAAFPKINKEHWGLPADWIDVSANRVNYVNNLLKPKKLVAGHMHKSVIHENVRILDINESIVFV
jgi:Icc-related predicted phosphoesterase